MSVCGQFYGMKLGSIVCLLMWVICHFVVIHPESEWPLYGRHYLGVIICMCRSVYAKVVPIICMWRSRITNSNHTEMHVDATICI